MSRQEELEKLRDQITKNIMDRGIDEGHGLDIIINEDDECYIDIGCRSFPSNLD